MIQPTTSRELAEKEIPTIRNAKDIETINFLKTEIRCYYNLTKPFTEKLVKHMPGLKTIYMTPGQPIYPGAQEILAEKGINLKFFKTTPKDTGETLDIGMYDEKLDDSIKSIHTKNDLKKLNEKDVVISVCYKYITLPFLEDMLRYAPNTVIIIITPSVEVTKPAIPLLKSKKIKVKRLLYNSESKIFRWPPELKKKTIAAIKRGTSIKKISQTTGIPVDKINNLRREQSRKKI